MMYHVLQILLHRPFLSYGHLHTRLPNMALDSFSTCASAADTIGLYLKSYERTHTFEGVPYFLFYAAYVSATIQVRIAAQKQLEANAFTHLLTSLRVFDENKTERSLAQKAKSRIEKLMMHTGVEFSTMGTSLQDMPEPQQRDILPTTATWPNFHDVQSSQQQQTSTTFDSHLASKSWDMDGLDIDALLQSFESASQYTESSFQPPGTLSGSMNTEAFNEPNNLGYHELYGFDSPGF